MNSSRRRTVLSDMFSACLVSPFGGAGEARWWARGQERVVRAGQVLFAEPGELQHIAPIGAPTSFFTVFWDPNVLEQAATELGLGGSVRWKSDPPNLDVRSALVRLSSLIQREAEGELLESAFAEATAELLLTAAETGLPCSRGGRHSGVRRAVRRLNSSFAEATSLTELAKEARLSKYHFVRCFRQATGAAPHRYRIFLRLHEARRLLERGSAVADAAYQTGFSDASHLSRTFRDWLGVTPGAWANAWRGDERGRAHGQAAPVQSRTGGR